MGFLGPLSWKNSENSEGPKGGRRKGGRGRKLSHFSFCCAFRCCVVYSPCFPVWGEEKVMTIYDAGPLAAGPLCGLLKNPPLNLQGVAGGADDDTDADAAADN